MTPRLGIALKLLVPGLAVAALAFHGFSRLGDAKDPERVVAQTTSGSRSAASGSGQRAERVGETIAGRVYDASAIDHASAERDDAQPATDLDTDDRRVTSADAPRTRSAWWWPFNGTANDPAPTMQPPASGVFVRLSSPAAPTAAASAASAATTDLVEFVAILRNGTTMGGDEFSVTQTRDLKIRVWWALNSQHVQRLELLSPDGSLYQRLLTSFDADTAKLEKRGNQSYVSVETVVPVAGTWITDHSLFGAWGVNVYLDEEAAASRSAAFVVNP